MDVKREATVKCLQPNPSKSRKNLLIHDTVHEKNQNVSIAQVSSTSSTIQSKEESRLDSPHKEQGLHVSILPQTYTIEWWIEPLIMLPLKVQDVSSSASNEELLSLLLSKGPNPGKLLKVLSADQFLWQSLYESF